MEESNSALSAEAALNPDAVYVVYCTCPDEPSARTLAQAIVAAQLAACVSLIPGLCSLYRWQGEVCEDREILLMIKTRAAAYAALERLILQQHPYQLPEILALPVSDGNPDYLQWVCAHSAAMGTEE